MAPLGYFEEGKGLVFSISICLRFTYSVSCLKLKQSVTVDARAGEK
jgi:hypothetical protein